MDLFGLDTFTFYMSQLNSTVNLKERIRLLRMFEGGASWETSPSHGSVAGDPLRAKDTSTLLREDGRQKGVCFT